MGRFKHVLFVAFVTYMLLLTRCEAPTQHTIGVFGGGVYVGTIAAPASYLAINFETRMVILGDSAIAGGFTPGTIIPSLSTEDSLLVTWRYQDLSGFYKLAIDRKDDCGIQGYYVFAGNTLPPAPITLLKVR